MQVWVCTSETRHGPVRPHHVEHDSLETVRRFHQPASGNGPALSVATPGTNWAAVSTAAWIPATEVSSDEESCTMRVALPGIDPNQVHVDLHGNILTISGRAHAPGTERPQLLLGVPLRHVRAGVHAGDQGRHRERHPRATDNGMLELTLPLSDTAKPRRIAIGTATPAGDGSAGLVA